MKLERMFWTVTRWARAARFWLVLAAALVAWLGVGGDAFAQVQGCVYDAPNSARCEYEGQARSAVHGMTADQTEYACYFPPGINYEAPVRSAATRSWSKVGRLRSPGGCGQGPNTVVWHGVASWEIEGCPPGMTWNEGLKACFDPDECLQRNGASNGMPAIETARPFSERCVAGCELKMEGPGSCTSIVGQPGSKMCSGVFQYSGNTCSATPGEPDEPPPPDPPESCEQVSNGQGGNSGVQVCKKKDGSECISTKSGASICWGTHETGTKSANDEQQTRGPGTTEPTPTPPTPPETFDPGKKTDPVTTTTTTTSPNGSTSTTTTTTVSNGTTNGTQPPGTPVPVGGGGGGNPGQGDDEDGTASGGGDCDTPPITTGDAVTGMVATQAWATRCAVEAGNTAKVTGDVGDCAAPFTVEGTNANAEQLRALRASICGPEETQRHDVETMKESVDELDAAIAAGEAEFGESVLIESGDVPALSLSRFGGGGSCPIISVAMPWGDTWEPPARFCDVVAALRLLFLAIATIWALRIIGDE